MLTEYSQQKLDSFLKSQKKQVSNFYQVIEVYEKIHMLEQELNLNYIFLYGSSISIGYNLKENDTLAYIANYILEKIEEKVEFSKVTFKKWDDMSNFDFNCIYNDISVNISFNTSNSKNCVVKYEEITTTTKKAIMNCI